MGEKQTEISQSHEDFQKLSYEKMILGIFENFSSKNNTGISEINTLDTIVKDDNQVIALVLFLDYLIFHNYLSGAPGRGEKDFINPSVGKLFLTFQNNFPRADIGSKDKTIYKEIQGAIRKIYTIGVSNKEEKLNIATNKKEDSFIVYGKGKVMIYDTIPVTGKMLQQAYLYFGGDIDNLEGEKYIVALGRDNLRGNSGNKSPIGQGGRNGWNTQVASGTGEQLPWLEEKKTIPVTTGTKPENPVEKALGDLGNAISSIFK